MKRSYLARKSFKKKVSRPIARKRKPVRKYGGTFTHRKYKRKDDYVKGLQRKAEELWKKAGKLLHGNECEVKKAYPQANILHTNVIQGDHCIIRGNKYFFLDVRNHSSICSACNKAKGFGNRSISRAVDDIVEKRHPAWFRDAVWLDQTKEANPSWRNPIWLEEKIQDLQDIISGDHSRHEKGCTCRPCMEAKYGEIF